MGNPSTPHAACNAYKWALPPSPLAALARIHNGKCLKHSLKNGSGIAMAFSSEREKGSHVAFCAFPLMAVHWEQATRGDGAEAAARAKTWAWADDSVSLSLLNQLGPLRAGSDVTHFEDLP